MAFAKSHPYLAAACEDFFILNPKATPQDPDALNRVRRTRRQARFRDGFGATLFRYARFVDTYDPVTGQRRSCVPGAPAHENRARPLDRRLPHRRRAHGQHRERRELGLRAGVQGSRAPAQSRALRGARPLAERGRALHGGGWGVERAAGAARAATGWMACGTGPSRTTSAWRSSGATTRTRPRFEATVRRAIDCREFGYADLAQAIIYLTSHEVEGFRNERLFNFFMASGVADAEKRTKLAFACLLTAVGIPMILAGEEFADQHDFLDANGNVTQNAGKQVDPVNFDPPRRRVARADQGLRVAPHPACAPRTTRSALNDIAFLHTDFEDGKRVMVWQRGQPGSDSQVVVVANFSDFATPNADEPARRVRRAELARNPARPALARSAPDPLGGPATPAASPCSPGKRRSTRCSNNNADAKAEVTALHVARDGARGRSHFRSA